MIYRAGFGTKPISAPSLDIEGAAKVGFYMAIFHLSHKKVGRSTHAAGTAGAHADYIEREKACRISFGEHMPSKRGATRRWLDEQEQSDRKNARVIDKLTLVLPLELDEKQRIELIRIFVNKLTDRKPVPWLAAIHDKGKDKKNPHCHLILRDRHIKTGKRAIGMSEKGSTERARQLWEEAVNNKLAKHGIWTEVSHKSLKAQRKELLSEAQERQKAGYLAQNYLDKAEQLNRKPQEHIGPTPLAIAQDNRHSIKLDWLNIPQTAPKPPHKPANTSTAPQRPTEAPTDAHRAQEALKADQTALRARKARRAAQKALCAAEHKRQTAQEILDDKRDLMTGEWKPSKGKSILPPRTGPEPTEEEMAHAEYLAVYCDADGDEMFSPPKPNRQDYHDPNQSKLFEEHLDQWHAGETARLERAAENKREIWHREFPAKYLHLTRINHLPPANLTNDILDVARSIFDWMRERVSAAKNLLGEKHSLVYEMQSDWIKALTRNEPTQELIRQDDLQQEQQTSRKIKPTQDETRQLWNDIEEKRKDHKIQEQKKEQQNRLSNSGPPMG